VERKVKERLVGAAVLMAAAVILIPEMLSGHRESSTEPAVAQSRNDDAPIKTYTIDLSHSSSEQPPSAVVENRAPPPEEPAAEQPTAAQPAAGDQAKPEVPQQTSSVQPEPQPAAQGPKPPVVEQPTAAASSARAPQHPLASSDDAPTSGRWAVQVGTFSKESNAQRLVKELRDQGQSAFVMPLKSGGGATLYRVRVGPMKDRASAEAALRELKSAGAKVVSHP
jgi:DedD protein